MWIQCISGHLFKLDSAREIGIHRQRILDMWIFQLVAFDVGGDGAAECFTDRNRYLTEPSTTEDEAIYVIEAIANAIACHEPFVCVPDLMRHWDSMKMRERAKRWAERTAATEAKTTN